MKLRWSLVGLVPAVVVFACSSGEKDERGSQGPLASQWAALTTGGVEATLSLQSDWGSGYCADVFLDNHGDTPVTSWSVTLNTRQSSINQLWNGTRDGDTVTPRASAPKVDQFRSLTKPWRHGSPFMIS